MPDDPLLGYKIRQQLFPGEDSYFKSNPTVTGMAAEDGQVILNPYAGPDVNRDAVAKNEALRLFLRDKNIEPGYALTEQQRGTFAGTPYAKDEAALKASIAARIYSGDPSAQATPEQSEWVQSFMRQYASPTDPELFDFATR